jgi:hypothetical protein
MITQASSVGVLIDNVPCCFKIVVGAIRTSFPASLETPAEVGSGEG